MHIHGDQAKKKVCPHSATSSLFGGVFDDGAKKSLISVKSELYAFNTFKAFDYNFK